MPPRARGDNFRPIWGPKKIEKKSKIPAGQPASQEREWHAVGTRMERGWNADGTRMARGWHADGTRMRINTPFPRRFKVPGDAI